MAVTWAWLRACGVPERGQEQGLVTCPIRQGLHWLAPRYGESALTPAPYRCGVRAGGSCLSEEVHAYPSRLERYSKVRAVVADAVWKTSTGRGPGSR